MTKPRKAPTPRRVWEPLTRVHETTHRGTGTVKPVPADTMMFGNSRYNVSVTRLASPAPGWPDFWHLSISRRDRKPISDWRDLQWIKNDVVGDENEGLQIHPAESRLVDSANQYHLWVAADPTWRIPLGFFDGRLVVDGHAVQDTGAVQRPLDAHMTPSHTPEEFDALLADLGGPK